LLLSLVWLSSALDACRGSGVSFFFSLSSSRSPLYVTMSLSLSLPSIYPLPYALHAATPCSWPPHLCGHPHLGASHGVPPPLRRAPGGSFQVWPWCWLWLSILGSIPTSLYWCQPLLFSCVHVPLRVLVGAPPLPGPVLHPPGAPTSLRLLTVAPNRGGCACG
jgi:hypothetical protein